MDLAFHLHFGWPQWVIVGLNALEVCVFCKYHGQPRKGTYDLRYRGIGILLTLWILYMGGFFS